MNGVKAKAKASYEESTRSVVLELSADVSSEIEIRIAGKEKITDNGDLSKRCSDLLQKMNLDLDTKLQVMKIINDPQLTLPVKCRKINTRCAKSAQHQDVVEALLEQITAE